MGTVALRLPQHATPPLPNALFSIIQLDWPWPHRDPKNHLAALGGTPYPGLPLEEAHNIPLRSVMQLPCAVFCWVTGPHLAEGSHLKLAQAWHIDFVAKAFTWVKTNPTVRLISFPGAPCTIRPTQEKGGDLRSGQGYHTNGNTEDCLVGWAQRWSERAHRWVPGPRLPRLSKKVKQLIFAPVTKHSEKPLEVYQRIEDLYGDLPRLDAFARRGVKGWTSWGAEAP